MLQPVLLVLIGPEYRKNTSVIHEEGAEEMHTELSI